MRKLLSLLFGACGLLYGTHSGAGIVCCPENNQCGGVCCPTKGCNADRTGCATEVCESGIFDKNGQCCNGYLNDGVCVANCSEYNLYNFQGYDYDGGYISKCVASCGDGWYPYNGGCWDECPARYTWDGYNGCGDTCPSDFPHGYDGECYASCFGIGKYQLNDSWNSECTDSCPELVDENGICRSYDECRNLGYYNDGYNCFSTCPDGYYTWENGGCGYTCPSSLPYTWWGDHVCHECPEPPYGDMSDYNLYEKIDGYCCLQGFDEYGNINPVCCNRDSRNMGATYVDSGYEVYDNTDGSFVGSGPVCCLRQYANFYGNMNGFGWYSPQCAAQAGATDDYCRDFYDRGLSGTSAFYAGCSCSMFGENMIDMGYGYGCEHNGSYCSSRYSMVGYNGSCVNSEQCDYVDSENMCHGYHG